MLALLLLLPVPMALGGAAAEATGLVGLVLSVTRPCDAGWAVGRRNVHLGAQKRCAGRRERSMNARMAKPVRDAIVPTEVDEICGSSPPTPNHANSHRRHTGLKVLDLPPICNVATHCYSGERGRNSSP